MNPLNIKSPQETRWDCLSLGEVMLRLDPGATRVREARQFEVWEGGGEYNVVRAIKKCWRLRSAIITALPKNDLGYLVENLIMQAGVDMSHCIWRDYDGIGRNTRVGLNFTERGFGIRPPMGLSDRANSAASQLRPGEINWEKIFGEEGVRWFHTGGIFAALSSSTAEVVIEAIEAAKKYNTIVSYDVNYRPSLWQAQGGKVAADNFNNAIIKNVDVLFGFDLEGLSEESTDLTELSLIELEQLIKNSIKSYSNIKAAAISLRQANSATVNDWGGVLYYDNKVYRSSIRKNMEILDRVGGGDGFASGIIYGYLANKNLQDIIEYGAAHGALAMTTPGDNSMARLEEVEALINAKNARGSR